VNFGGHFFKRRPINYRRRKRILARDPLVKIGRVKKPNVAHAILISRSKTATRNRRNDGLPSIMRPHLQRDRAFRLNSQFGGCVNRTVLSPQAPRIPTRCFNGTGPGSTHYHGLRSSKGCDAIRGDLRRLHHHLRIVALHSDTRIAADAATGLPWRAAHSRRPRCWTTVTLALASPRAESVVQRHVVICLVKRKHSPALTPVSVVRQIAANVLAAISS
jgi:hypothetical protein